MARSFDVELMDKMLAKPFLPSTLVERLCYAKGIVTGALPHTNRTEELSAAVSAIDDVIQAVNGHPTERTKAT